MMLLLPKTMRDRFWGSENSKEGQMNLSRVIVGGVILSIVLLLLPRQSSGDKAVPRIVKLTIDCENRFDVTDVDPGVTQDPPDIYVC